MKNFNKYLHPKILIDYSYPVKNILLTQDLIIDKIIHFWDTIIKKLDPKQYVLFLFKIKFSSNWNICHIN